MPGYSPYARTPSQFTATNAAEAAVDCFSKGWSAVLPSSYAADRFSRCTSSENGSLKFYNQLSANLVNLNASMRPPNAVWQTPSIFNCTTTNCTSTFCFSQGFSDVLNDVQQKNLNGGCANGQNGTSKSYGNLCGPIYSFGGGAS